MIKKVVIYTGPMCNYCSAAKHLLNKKKINYTELDVEADPSKMKEMQERTKGARTIPQIFIGDTYVGGYMELKSLETQGELDNLLKS
jgi:glutaredoxin 3